MFGLFKRTRIESWEKDFLKTVFAKLSGNNQEYINQIESGLFKRVLLGISDIPNYVGFTYDSSLYKNFYKAKSRNYMITNIKVRDEVSRNYLSTSIYISHGVINGYSIENDKNIKKYKLMYQKLMLLVQRKYTLITKRVK